MMNDSMRMTAARRHHLLNEDMHDPEMKRAEQVSRFPEHTPIGMAYVPVQQWGETYTAEEALCRGTIFQELDFPFSGGDCAYDG
ncbi:MAG: spore coat associated protein CotJA [Ruminococcus sp.]|nr:spore coat associated protein CotJA [Ruminococcus sp.]